ncbi:uncharacterized protein ACIBXB_004402 isoform 1-T1 [Morphnus guianensis]
MCRGLASHRAASSAGTRVLPAPGTARNSLPGAGAWLSPAAQGQRAVAARGSRSFGGIVPSERESPGIVRPLATSPQASSQAPGLLARPSPATWMSPARHGPLGETVMGYSCTASSSSSEDAPGPQHRLALGSIVLRNVHAVFPLNSSSETAATQKHCRAPAHPLWRRRVY